MDTTIIKLNVGGTVFTTSKSTLMNSPWFVAFFSGKFKTEKINNDEYFIDRNPDIFPAVLEYLRNGRNIHLCYFDGNKNNFDNFRYECEYFGLTVENKWSPNKQWKYTIISETWSTYNGREYINKNIQKTTDEGYKFISMTSNIYNAKLLITMVFGKEK